MSQAYQCDRCKKFVPGISEQEYYGRFRIYRNDGHEELKIELCDDCQAVLADFLKMPVKRS